jgi:hypothetical protein
MKVTWIDYRGKKILFSNYEGCKTSKDMIAVLYKEAEILKNQEGKTLVMANYDKSFGSAEYMEALKNISHEVLKKKIEKTATLGITGVKEALFKSYIFFTNQKNVKLFYDKEEALNWLTQE